jgi:hypothetical protein
MTGVATAWIAAVTAYFEPARECDDECGRNATWWGDLHGCTQAAVCQHCLDDWYNWNKGLLYVHGALQCTHCKKVFPSIESIIKVRPI